MEGRLDRYKCLEKGGPDARQPWGLSPQAINLQMHNHVEKPPPSKARQPDNVTKQEGNGQQPTN